MRPTRKKGSKMKAKVLPLEVDLSEYIEIIKAMKHLRHKIAVMLAMESGLRISEVVNLKKEDFDFKNNEIRVNQGKNSKDRIVALPVSWQKHHINYIPIPCKQRALQKAFIAAAELIGLKLRKPKIHFHSLRHGHATESVRAGIRLEEIKDSLGHSDLAVTSVYINLCPVERIRNYRSKFGNRNI